MAVSNNLVKYLNFIFYLIFFYPNSMETMYAEHAWKSELHRSVDVLLQLVHADPGRHRELFLIRSHWMSVFNCKLLAFLSFCRHRFSVRSVKNP